jgi:hypothetical protein
MGVRPDPGGCGRRPRPDQPLRSIAVRYRGLLGGEQEMRVNSLPDAIELETFIRFGLGLDLIGRDIYRADGSWAASTTWETAVIDLAGPGL